MMAAMMVAALTASAQNDDLENEIGVYYGFGSASDIVSTVGSAFSFSSSDQSSFWGPIGVEFYHHVNPVVAVGAVASIAGCTWNKNDDFTTTYYTVMPSVKFNWLRKNHFGMYSSLSAGLMVQHNSMKNNGVKDSNTGASFIWHVNAVGMEFGGQLRGFGELGFGEKGILCAGLRYKF